MIEYVIINVNSSNNSDDLKKLVMIDGSDFSQKFIFSREKLISLSSGAFLIPIDSDIYRHSNLTSKDFIYPSQHFTVIHLNVGKYYPNINDKRWWSYFHGVESNFEKGQYGVSCNWLSDIANDLSSPFKRLDKDVMSMKTLTRPILDIALSYDLFPIVSSTNPRNIYRSVRWWRELSKKNINFDEIFGFVLVNRLDTTLADKLKQDVIARYINLISGTPVIRIIQNHINERLKYDITLLATQLLKNKQPTSEIMLLYNNFRYRCFQSNLQMEVDNGI